MSTNPVAGVLAAASDELAAAVEKAARSLVAIHARRRIPSSGVHWTPGVIVTAHHTLERDRDIEVALPDGTHAAAQIAGRDPGTDLAVLRVDNTEFETAPPADANRLRPGSLVLAVGKPSDEGVSASLGIISAVGGEFRTWHGGRIDRLVRLDISIHDGFSGGPLIDATGAVLGINTSALARRGGGLTLPVTTVERVVAQLLAKGRIARGYLGAGLQPVRLPPALQQAGGRGASTGLLVTLVSPGGPAERAGLMLGDIIVGFNGWPIRDLRDLAALLGPETVGKRTKLELIRAGQALTLEVEVVERSAREDEWS